MAGLHGLKVLLDTCTFLWLDASPERLGPAARVALAKSSTTRFLSHATIWELAIKTSLGKLSLTTELPEIIEAYEKRGIITLLPIELPHLYRLAALPWVHRDPFDRLLVAQALAEGLTLITPDPTINGYGAETLWE